MSSKITYPGDGSPAYRTYASGGEYPYSYEIYEDERGSDTRTTPQKIRDFLCCTPAHTSCFFNVPENKPFYMTSTR